MNKHGIVKFQGRTFIAVDEPVMKAEDRDGVFTFTGFKELFLCDPKKNLDCSKSRCQKLCRHTFDKKFAKDDQTKGEYFNDILFE